MEDYQTTFGRLFGDNRSDPTVHVRPARRSSPNTSPRIETRAAGQASSPQAGYREDFGVGFRRAAAAGAPKEVVGARFSWLSSDGQAPRGASPSREEAPPVTTNFLDQEWVKAGSQARHQVAAAGAPGALQAAEQRYETDQKHVAYSTQNTRGAPWNSPRSNPKLGFEGIRCGYPQEKGISMIDKLSREESSISYGNGRQRVGTGPGGLVEVPFHTGSRKRLVSPSGVVAQRRPSPEVKPRNSADRLQSPDKEDSGRERLRDVKASWLDGHGGQAANRASPENITNRQDRVSSLISFDPAPTSLCNSPRSPKGVGSPPPGPVRRENQDAPADDECLGSFHPFRLKRQFVPIPGPALLGSPRGAAQPAGVVSPRGATPAFKIGDVSPPPTGGALSYHYVEDQEFAGFKPLDSTLNESIGPVEHKRIDNASTKNWHESQRNGKNERTQKNPVQAHYHPQVQQPLDEMSLRKREVASVRLKEGRRMHWAYCK